MTAPIPPDRVTLWSLRLLLLANLATLFAIAVVHDAALYPSGQLEHPWRIAWLGDQELQHWISAHLHSWCTTGLTLVYGGVVLAWLVAGYARRSVPSGGGAGLTSVAVALWSWSYLSFPWWTHDSQSVPVYLDGYWRQLLSAAALALLGVAGWMLQRQLARSGPHHWTVYVRLWLPITLAIWMAPVAADALPGLEQRAVAARLKALLEKAEVRPHAVHADNVDLAGDIGVVDADGGVRLLSRDREYRAKPGHPLPSVGKGLLLFFDRTATVRDLHELLQRIPVTQPIAVAFLATTAKGAPASPAAMERAMARARAMPVLRPEDPEPPRVLRSEKREPQIARVFALRDSSQLLASVPLEVDYVRVEHLPSSREAGQAPSDNGIPVAWSTAPVPELRESWLMELGPLRWLLVLVVGALGLLDVRALARKRR